MATIALKIHFLETNSTKVIQFPATMTIAEACKDIRERIGDQVAGANDHSLFFPFLNRWLQATRTLDFYDLKSGDEVIYRKKHRPLRVKLMDMSIKTVLVDDSAPVHEIVESICKKIGISNPDEYSLQKDEPLSSGGSGAGSLKKSGSKDHLAIEEGHWLNPEKTLSEQGVYDVDILLLKKKFFFSDQNVDTNDPIQLNLIYEQSRDAIVSGKHPCTFEEASMLAALQCQIQYGNHEPDKHKPGFIKLKEFVPPEYHGSKKEMEKKIFQEHRKLQGLTDLNAKFRYVQLCRSFKTYGISFFLVKEKVPKKSKLEPVLLGVSRNRITKLNVETKDIVKEWPLTTLRRWAAAPNSLTLDFGDYADAYYSVQTAEGEQISQIIGGYIDIILKKRQDSARDVEEENVEMAIAEESIKPARATAVNISSVKKGRAVEVDIATAGVVIDNADRVDSRKIVRKKLVATAGESVIEQRADVSAQHGILQTINNGFASINSALADLSVPIELPPMSNDQTSQNWKAQTIEMNRHLISAHTAAQITAAANIVNLTNTSDPDSVDLAELGGNVSALAANVSQIIASTRMLAALTDDSSKAATLTDYANNLSASSQKLVQAVEPFVSGEAFETDNKPRQLILSLGKEVSNNSHSLLVSIDEVDVSIAAQDEIVKRAKAVAKSTAKLVSEGIKRLLTEGSELEEVNLIQPQLIEYAKLCASSAENLVSLSIIAAPAMNQGSCQNQINQGTANLRDALDKLQGAILPITNRLGPDNQAISNCFNFTQNVQEDIAKLIEVSKDPAGATSGAGESEYEKQIGLVLDSCSAMAHDVQSPTASVHAAKSVALAATQLVNLMKTYAQNSSSAESENWGAASQNLASSTSDMISSVKQYSKNPTEFQQAELMKSIQSVEKLAMSFAGPQLKTKMVSKLINTSKQVAASAAQLVSTCKVIAPTNRNQNVQLQFNQAAKQSSDAMSSVVSSMKVFSRNPSDSHAQIKFVNAVKQAIGPSEHLVAIAKEAAQTTADIAAQAQLNSCVSRGAQDLSTLHKILHQIESTSAEIEYSAVVETLSQVQADLKEAKSSIQSGKLRVAEFRPVELVQSDVENLSGKLNNALSHLVSTSLQGNDRQTGLLATETAAGLQAFATAVKNLAVISVASPASQEALIQRASQLGDVVVDLISNSKMISDAMSGAATIDDPLAFATLKQNVEQQAFQAQQLVESINMFLPGKQEISNAIEVVSAGIEVVAAGPAVMNRQDKNVIRQATEESSKFSTAVATLSSACNNLITANQVNNGEEIKTATAKFEESFSQMINSYQFINSAAPSNVALSENVKSVAETSLKFLQSLKHSTADGKANLTTAAKAIASSVSKLLEISNKNLPGSAECHEAEQILIGVSGKLQSVNEGSNRDSAVNYFDLLEKVIIDTQKLSASFSNVSSAYKVRDTLSLGVEIQKFAINVQSVVENALSAAYVIGSSDPSSSAAVPSIIDGDALLNACADVQTSFSDMINPNNRQQDILNAASIIAKNTSMLCNITKQASLHQRVSSSSKQQLISIGKAIITNTAALVEKIKLLASSVSAERILATENAFKPLWNTLEELSTISQSTEFCAKPASISPMAIEKQKPIIKSCEKIFSRSQEIISKAKQICTGGRDAIAESLTSDIKLCSESLKNLINSLKQGIPGQKECEEAIEKVVTVQANIEASILQAQVGNLKIKEKSIPTQQNQVQKDAVLANIKALTAAIQPIADSARGKSEQKTALGDAVLLLARNIEPTTTIAVQYATMAHLKPSVQKKLFETVREVGDAAVQFLEACKESGGNPESGAAHEKIDEYLSKFHDSLSKMQESLEGTAQGTKELNELTKRVDSIIVTSKAETANFSASPSNATPVDVSFHDSVQNISKTGKVYLELLSNSIVSVDTLTAQNAIPLAENLTESFNALVSDARIAAQTTTDPKVKEDIMEEIRQLGSQTNRVIDAIKGAVISAGASDGVLDPGTRQKLSTVCRGATAEVSKLIKTAKETSRGLAMCEQAIQLLEDILVDLESHVAFAHAGHLDPIDQAENFKLYKDALNSKAKELVEVSKEIVSGSASSNQDDLAQAVIKTSSHVSQFREIVKKAVVSITSSDKIMQEQLLQKTKETVNALLNLIKCAMDVSGKAITAGGMENLPDEISKLRESAKILVSFISDLLKTIKTISDESLRGLRAIDGAKAEITEVTKLLLSDLPAEGSALPEEMVAAAKSLATASANLVSVATTRQGFDQDKIVSVANNLKNETATLIRCGKSAIDKAPDNVRQNVIAVLFDCSEAAKYLLETVKQVLQGSNPNAKLELQEKAKAIAQSVNRVVQSSASLVPTGYVDPNDPNFIAERELLAAANSIEAAAKKLSQMRPPERPREADENLNFEEQVFEAAKAIASAASALVKSATAAQREISATHGKISSSSKSYATDGTWSEGLVSAAKLVAIATSDLCEAANAAVKGEVRRERVIAAARSVSTSTTQLLTAASVKSNGKSEAQMRLKAAGRSVVTATEQLVKAAEETIMFDEKVDPISKGSDSFTKQRADELDAQSRVVQMEKELEMARAKLANLRKGKYQK